MNKERFKELYLENQKLHKGHLKFYEEHFAEAGFSSPDEFAKKIKKVGLFARKEYKQLHSLFLKRWHWERSKEVLSSIFSQAESFFEEEKRITEQSDEVSCILKNTDIYTVNRYCLAGYKATFEAPVYADKTRVHFVKQENSTKENIDYKNLDLLLYIYINWPKFIETGLVIKPFTYNNLVKAANDLVNQIEEATKYIKQSEETFWERFFQNESEA